MHDFINNNNGMFVLILLLAPLVLVGLGMFIYDQIEWIKLKNKNGDK